MGIGAGLMKKERLVSDLDIRCANSLTGFVHLRLLALQGLIMGDIYAKW